jgi:hypothetical protein
MALQGVCNFIKNKIQMVRHTFIPSVTRNLLLSIFFCFFCTSLSFAQTTDSTSSYNSIHYRGSAEVEINEQIFNCQYNFVNVIDSFLYIQLNIGPIEAGRALITPNTVLYINKLQKKYYDGDYSFFQHLLDLDIDFFAIQATFNGYPIYVSEEIELSYHGKSVFDEYSFFNILTCEYENLSLRLDVKKVTFNNVPKVSATVPKNFTVISF